MADLSVTAANVVEGADARKETGVAGATITAGQVVYKDASDANKFKLCDVDSATAAARVPYGIALHGASAGQPLTVITAGNINPGATAVVGKVYVASDTAGGIMPVDDLEAGDYTSIIGIGTTASNIKLGILSGGVAVP